ncbi:hypothetical protein EYF80_033444 [Liparis tanakae]|uniref:Uncharacterized protein n=1 Tax=Liparis tanakae TaxID=230148 RepID=A0A4Z2GUB4_9TELE|nr:hypothetical protein EYF80_033444 [Liparis tanakae]
METEEGLEQIHRILSGLYMYFYLQTPAETSRDQQRPAETSRDQPRSNCPAVLDLHVVPLERGELMSAASPPQARTSASDRRTRTSTNTQSLSGLRNCKGNRIQIQIQIQIQVQDL